VETIDAQASDNATIAFEVTLDDPHVAVHMAVPADNWIEAWQLALAELGTSATPSEVQCGIYPGDKIVVDVLTTGQRLVVRSQGRVDKARTERAAISDAELPLPPRPAAVLTMRRRTLSTLDHGSVQGWIPAVGQLSDDRHTAIEQALDMLVQHIPAASHQYLRQAGSGEWVVAAARGWMADELCGWSLAPRQPMVQLASQGALRLQHVQQQAEGGRSGAVLEYRRPPFDPLLEQVHSICGTPVPGHGVLLLVDSPRDDGFSEGELKALAYAAELIGRRHAS